MVFIFALGVGISCCGSSLAWLFGGSGVGARAIGNTCNGGGMGGGGSIDASACVALEAARNGGGGGGEKKRPWLDELVAAGSRGGGGGGKGGKGGKGDEDGTAVDAGAAVAVTVAGLLTGNDAFRDVPHDCSLPLQ